MSSVRQIFPQQEKRGLLSKAVVHYLTKSYKLLLLHVWFPQLPVKDQLFCFHSVSLSLFASKNYKLLIFQRTFATVMHQMMQARVLESHLDRGVNSAGLRKR